MWSVKVLSLVILETKNFCDVAVSYAYTLYLETVSTSIANSENEKYGANNESELI